MGLFEPLDRDRGQLTFHSTAETRKKDSQLTWTTELLFPSVIIFTQFSKRIIFYDQTMRPQIAQLANVILCGVVLFSFA
jgi:hypothetical protein